MLTAEQNEDLERLQAQSLKIIYGFNQSYRTVLELSGLEKLESRRERAIEKFAVKTLHSQYSHWFPRNENRTSRVSKKYKEEYARCERLKNTPIFYMRRVLNRLETV